MKKPSLLSLLLLACAGMALAAESSLPASLDLPGAIQLALVADPQVLTAQAGLARAKAAVEQELAKIAPGCTVTANRGQTPYRIAGHSELVDETTVTFTIAQNRPGLLPRIIGGRAASAVEQAMWDQVDAEAKLAQAKIVATAGAVQKYLAAIKTGDLTRLSQGALDLAKDDEKIARASLEAGTTTRLDVLKAESNREKAALELRVAEANRRLALDALLLQIGRPLGAELKLASVSSTRPAAQEDLEKLHAKAVTARADAIAARTAVLKAEAALVQSRNASLPDIKLSAREQQGDYAFSVILDLTTGNVQWTLGGSFEESSTPLPSGPTERSDGLNLGLELTWTPFDGGLRRATVAAAEAGLASAKIAQDRLVGEVRLEIRQRLSDLNLAALKLAQAKREKELATQTRELAALRYREGVGLFAELGQATQALAQAEFGVVQAEYDLLQAQVALAVSCGQMPGLAAAK